MPEAAIAHDADGTIGLRARDRRGGSERHAVAENGIALAEGREGRKRVAADVGRDVHRPHLLAQQLHGREHGTLRAAGAEGRRPRRQGSAQRLVDFHPLRVDLGDPCAQRRCRVAVAGAEGGEALAEHKRRIFARHRQQALAVQLGLQVGLAQDLADRLLDEIGVALLDHQHGLLVSAEGDDLLGHQRVHDVEHQGRQRHVAVAVAEARQRQPAVQHVEQAALDDDADIAVGRPEPLVELVVDDEPLRRGQPPSHLVDFLAEGGGRVAQPVVVEAGRSEAILGREAGRHVVARNEAAEHVAGADAQLENDRRVGGFRQLEALLDRAHQRGQVGPGIDQPQRRFQRKGMRALLDDAGALAVVLADDDEGAADDTGRGEVGQRVGRDIGADDRLPGDGAAQGIVDRGGQHGGRRRLVGAGLQMNAEIAEQALRLHQHVEQMAHRRALIAADVGDARLQQRLGHGQDAFAIEGVAGAQPQALDLLVERNFSHCRRPCHPGACHRDPAYRLLRRGWSCGSREQVPG